MTKTAPITIRTIFVNRLFIFESFLDYWNVKNSNMYNNHDAFFKEIECYSNLYAEWQFNRWELKELDKICSKIDEGLQELNPYFFYGEKKLAMLTILKVGIYLKQMFKCAPLFFLEMEAIIQFQRYERLVRLLIIHRNLTIILLNNEDI